MTSRRTGGPALVTGIALVARAALGSAALLAAAPPVAAREAPASYPVTQNPAPCPPGVGAEARCWSGRAASGAYYWIAEPARWNGVLLVHAHGGPRLGPPTPDAPREDLARYAAMVREGAAWIGSSYRRGGYGVRMAAEDTEEARRLFLERVGRPRLTILHGQSWGGNVAAKLGETLAADPDGRPRYDGILLTSGVLAGGTRAYDFRADLRAVYNFYCRNHPRPDEPAYPLGIGLPADSTMSEGELDARVDACTGVRRKPEARSEAQARALGAILAVVRVPERSLLTHLAFATFMFRDIVHERLGDRDPFGNAGVAYLGSPDDAALNAGVQRFAADPAALAALADDSDLTGAIPVPTLTVHGIDDPIAFVEQEARYAEVVAAAGRSDRLVQTFVDSREHSDLGDATRATALAALVRWIETGTRPAPADLASACPEIGRHLGAPCRFRPDYVPKPLATRMYPR